MQAVPEPAQEHVPAPVQAAVVAVQAHVLRAVQAPANQAVKAPATKPAQAVLHVSAPVQPPALVVAAPAPLVAQMAQVAVEAQEAPVALAPAQEQIIMVTSTPY